MSNLQHALKYAARGFKIFPLHYINRNGNCSCGSANCTPKNAGKHTIYKCAPNGHLNATSDIETIKTWWTNYPLANIGLNCKDSGLLVVDVDLHDEDKNGFESLADFEFTHDEQFDTKFIASTGGGGAHFFFKAPDNLESCPANLGDNYKGIDLKYRGYVLLAPSNHRSGNCYSWDNKCDAEFYPENIPPLPKCLAEFIDEATRDVKYSPARNTFAYRDVDSEELEQIRDALSYISPDAADYHEMLKVGMALQYYLGDSNGWQLFLEWASRSSKFKMKKCLKHWRSFRRTAGGVRNIASLFDVAASYGFENVGFNREHRINLIDPEDYFYMSEPVAEAIRGEQIVLMHIDWDCERLVNGWHPVIHIDYSAKPFNYYDYFLYIDYDAKPNYGAYDEDDGVPMYIDWDAKPYLANNEIYIDYSVRPYNPDDYLEMFIDYSAAPIVGDWPDEDESEIVYFTPNNQYQIADIDNVSINDSELKSLFDKTMEFGRDENRGKPSKAVLDKWHKKLNNNPVLCDLFDLQWRCTSKFIPQMALAFAIASAGSMLAGRFSLNTLTTNLYFIVTGETAIGKSQTLSLMKKLHVELGDEIRIGGDTLRSDKGMRNELLESAAKVFMIDEFGLFLQGLSDPRAPENKRAIVRSVLEGFTLFADEYSKEGKLADKKLNTTEVLKYACPSIVGLTTSSTLWKGLHSSQSASGMFNRLLILEAVEDCLDESKISETMKAVPQNVLTWHREVKQRVNAGSAGGLMQLDNYTPPPINLGMTEKALASIDGIMQIQDRMCASGGEFGDVFKRLAEITIRMGLIFELTKNPRATMLGNESIVMAYELVKECLKLSHASISLNVTDSEEEEFNNEVDKAIYKFGASGVTRTVLMNTRPLKGSPNRLAKCASALITQGRIRKFNKRSTDGNRGRSSHVYVSSAFAGPDFAPPEGWTETFT